MPLANHKEVRTHGDRANHREAKKPTEMAARCVPPEISQAWLDAMRKLEKKLFPISFSTWIKPLVPLAREENRWTVGAPEFVARWIEKHYLGDLVEALGGDMEVQLCAESL